MPIAQHDIGVCSWSLRPDGPDALIASLKTLGLKKLQLALDPIRLDPARWEPLPGLLAVQGIQIVSAQFGTVGEDYTSPATIRATGGVVPDAHWAANLENILTHLVRAGRLGVTRISSHAGFIPPDSGDPVFATLVERVGTIADLCREAGDIDFLLETGQETAETLSGFLAAVDRPNLGVNFDPANMLLYDMGDPLAAVKQLLPVVRQVHIKDATPPTEPGAWGEEVPVGQGRVDWPAFLGVLIEHGYRGDWIIEREGGDERVRDVATARDVLCRLPL